MSTLDLSTNSIGDVGGSAIFKCIRKIDRLYVKACGLTNQSVEDLACELLNHDITASINRM